MDNDISLKREMFALNIRRDQRDRKMKEIREMHAKMTKDETHEENFNEADFQKYKELTRKNNFGEESTLQAFEYLFSKNVASVFSNENNLKFIFEFTSRVDQQNDPQEWQVFVIKKINDNIKELIKREIFLSPKDNDGFMKPTRELDDLSLIKKCFGFILNLATSFPCYFELVYEMSIIRNKNLKNEVFVSLKEHFSQNYKNLSSNQIEIVIYTMENLYDDLKSLPHEMIHILETILLEYDLGFEHAEKIVDFFTNFLERDQIFEKIKFLIEDTSIYEGLVEYLDKSKNSNSFELVSKLALFVFKFYSSDDRQLCEKIYEKNPLILSQIRSWLPLAPSTTTPRPFVESTKQLLHTNFSCTQNLISALTNITASGYQFMAIILTQSDIYFSVISLYHICPVSCREEIAIFVRNCVYCCDKGMRRIILDGGLVELLIEMMREEGSKIITKTALITILWMIRNGLEDNPVEGEKWGYSKRKFIRNLESEGGLREIELCENSDDSDMSTIAGHILNVIRE